MLSLATLSQRLAPTLDELARRDRQGTLAAPVDLAAMGEAFAPPHPRTFATWLRCSGDSVVGCSASIAAA